MYSKAEQALMNKYRNHFGDDWDLVDCRAMTWPFYGVDVSYKYSLEEPLPLVEEYVLKALQTGCIQTVESLGQFLGLEPAIVETVLADLHQKGIVELLPYLSLTPKGTLLLGKQTRRVLKEEKKRIYIDGVSGECSFVDVKGSRNREATVKPAIVRPRAETLEHHYRNLHKSISKELSKVEKKSKQPDDGQKYTPNLEEIIGFQGKTHRLYVDRLILFYKDNSSDSGRFLVLTDGEIDEEATRHLEERLQQGKSGFDITEQQNFDRTRERLPVENVSMASGKPQKVAGLEDLDRCSEATVIEMLDHPVLLKLAIKIAKEHLIINSPWIRDDVVDGVFKKNLEGALKKGVSVYIFYGMQSSKGQRKKRSDISSNAKQFFKRLEQSKQYDFHLVKQEGNHAKVLICDDRFMVITSYNWLSFPGNKSESIRVETGTLIKKKEDIERKRTDMISRAE